MRELRRKIEFDPFIFARRGEHAAQSVKARLFIVLQMSRFPEDVRAGERRVAAEFDFDGGRKPAQIVTVPQIFAKTPSPINSFPARRAASIHRRAGSGKMHTAAGLPP